MQNAKFKIQNEGPLRPSDTSPYEGEEFIRTLPPVLGGVPVGGGGYKTALQNLRMKGGAATEG